MTPYYFLDESGDPGLADISGSSGYLAMAIVELESRDRLPVLAATRARLHLAVDFEFKYHGAKTKQRDAFFHTLQSLQFRAQAAIVSKEAVFDNWAALDGEERLADLAIRLIMRSPRFYQPNSVLVVDGAKARQLRTLRNQLSDAWRQEGRLRPFAKIISGDSAREDGLQVADMLVGAARDYVVNKRGACFQAISNKISDLWIA